MKKHTILYILIVILVAANGFLIYNQFGGKGRGNHKSSRKGPTEFIVKKLDFNESQTAQLESINIEHKAKIKAIFKDLRTSKKDLFSNLSETPLNQVKIDSIINSIAEKTKVKEEEMFLHLRAIQAICDDEQKEKLQRIINDIIQKRGRHGGQESKD